MFYRNIAMDLIDRQLLFQLFKENVKRYLYHSLMHIQVHICIYSTGKKMPVRMDCCVHMDVMKNIISNFVDLKFSFIQITIKSLTLKWVFLRI